MLALSLIEPWATLLVLGVKKFETRSWKTPHRGWIAVHASKRMPREAREYFAQNRWAREAFEAAGLRLDARPLGCVIGRVFVEDCIRTETLRDQLDQRELSFGDFSDNRYGWKMRGAIQHKPIEAKGALMLWRWEPPVGFDPGAEPEADPPAAEPAYDPQQSLF